MHGLTGNELTQRFFRYISIVSNVAVLFALSVYAYGGLFARYQADDYCETVYLLSASHILEAVIHAYNTWLNSYSILFLVQLTELGGLWGFRLMTAMTLVLWLAGLTWLTGEIGKFFHARLNLWMNMWLAALIIFLSLYQAPNLHQILYWRTALIPYTVPLVFFIYIAALLLWYVRFPCEKRRALGVGLLVSGLVFFAGGLGETTAALQVGLLASAVLLVWLTRSKHGRTDLLMILLIALALSVLVVIIIALSPGTATRLEGITSQRAPLFNPITLSTRTLLYTLLFVADALRVAPLPNFLLFALPFGICYFHFSQGRQISPHTRLAALLLPLLMIIVIGCSFAPSVFAQSYPVARARFAAHFVLAFSLAWEGSLLGMLASRIQLPNRVSFARGLLLVLLGMASVYPLRAAANLYTALSDFRAWSAAWDARDAYIRQAVAEGVTDLVVVQLDTIGGVQEYKHDANHWVNKCAAEYYGLRTLRAP